MTVCTVYTDPAVYSQAGLSGSTFQRALGLPTDPRLEGSRLSSPSASSSQTSQTADKASQQAVPRQLQRALWPLELWVLSADGGSSMLSPTPVFRGPKCWAVGESASTFTSLHGVRSWPPLETPAGLFTGVHTPSTSAQDTA